MPRRRCLTLLLALLMLAPAAPVLALEAKLMEMRVAGGSVFAALDVRELFPEKFQAVLRDGAAIHLRLQIELWEDRPIWDRLAHPAVVSVFRMVLDPQSNAVKVADQYGEVARQAAWQEPLSLRVDIGRADTLADGVRYYVRAQATLGTIAEKESATASNAVFGDDDSSVSIASMGKMLFHAVLQVNEYLQSVTADTRSRLMTGREIKAGVKLQ